MTDFQVIKINVPGTLYDVIDRMRERTAMWLGEATLSGLVVYPPEINVPYNTAWDELVKRRGHLV